jgi:uncharacterized membrane protein
MPEGIALLVIAVCSVVILVITIIFWFTLYDAAREASEYFHRENERHRREADAHRRMNST